MNASEAVEQSIIEGLHAQGNAVDAAASEQFSFVERQGGRIAFDGPFGYAGQGKPLRSAEDSLPLAQVEERGGAAAEKYGARPEVGGDPFELANQRTYVAIDNLTGGRLGIEGAVETLPRAEGHMDIEPGNRLGRRLGHSGR